MKNPLISILTTVYNSEKYLEENIKSVLEQTYDNIELIIVNDGSTDKSEDIIKSFKDKRIKYFRIENSGQSSASNYAFNKSKGEYINFLDADDILSENHIEIMLNCLDRKKNELVFCEWGRFYGAKKETAIFDAQPYHKISEPVKWLKTNLQIPDGDMLAAWLWLIPRNLFIEGGGWHEELSLNNDFDFSIRLVMKAEKINFAKGAKIYYRSGIEKNSLSLSNSHKAAQSALKTTVLGCAALCEIENSEEIKQICANRFQTWAFRIFPQQPEIVKQLEENVKKYGGSNNKMQGGRIFIILRNIFGWKKAKLIRGFFYKIKWKIVNLKHEL